MNETYENEVMEPEVVVVEEGWLTKFGRKLDEKKADRKAKKAAMTPEEQKKKFWTKLGLGAAGIVAVVVGASMLTGGEEVEALPEGQDYDDGEAPFESTESLTESVN